MQDNLMSIIIPTYNNPQYLNPCVMSILKTGILNGFSDLIIVNNGSQPLEKEFAGINGLKIVNAKDNLGWEGGLKEGLKHTSARFVCFQNDDTHIPAISRSFYQRLLVSFQDKNVAAVGPMTTCAAGIQSMYHPHSPSGYVDVNWLIFFTVMIRREHLDEVGGIDTALPGGDDFDLSIRLRSSGYKLRVSPDAFLIHHGFKTGERVHGGPQVSNGWNSPEMTETTNTALIRKHGFKTFFNTLRNQITPQPDIENDDPEADIIKDLANGPNILELGCGPKKLIPSSIGIDITPNGQVINEQDGRVSVADVVADVTQELPEEIEKGSFDTIIASHVLEHCIDTIKTLKLWREYLREDGQMIIAVPDEEVTSGIPLNPEHCHAFTQQSLAELLEVSGFRTKTSESTGNGISFVISASRVELTSQKEVASC